MTTLVQALRTELINAGLENVFVTTAPDISPCILLTPYGSDTSIYIPLGRQSIQCRIRADTYAGSESIAWQAFLAIVEAKPACNRIVKGIVPHQEPLFIGFDEGNNFIYTFNFDVIAIWKERLS
ncbi:minor capsid protein [Aminobacterium colombiense]